MGTLRFFEEVVSFKIRRTFGFADYRLLSSEAKHGFFTHPRRSPQKIDQSAAHLQQDTGPTQKAYQLP